MSKKQTVINILIGSVILGLANAVLYTFRGLAFWEAFLGYAMLTFVVLLFLTSFIPSGNKYHKHTSRAKNSNHLRSKNRGRSQSQAKQEKARVASKKDDRISGTVKWYDPRKAYGFLSYGENEVFFHRHSIRSHNHHMEQGDAVCFYVGDSEKGPQATDVWHEGDANS